MSVPLLATGRIDGGCPVVHLLTEIKKAVHSNSIVRVHGDFYSGIRPVGPHNQTGIIIQNAAWDACHEETSK